MATNKLGKYAYLRGAMKRPHPKGVIRSKTEDSLNPRKTRYLANHGWDYNGKRNAWVK